MAFTRVEYSVRIYPEGSRGASSENVYPESIVLNYGINRIPSAVVELAIGQPFDLGGRTRSQRQADLIQEWANDQTLLSIEQTVVSKTIASPQGPSTETKILFEGYIDAPTISLSNAQSSLQFLMRHWLRDLTIGSIRADYAFPSGPGSATSVLYNGAAGLPTAAHGFQGKLEGVAYRVGLPIDWERTIHQDIWGRGLKPILTGLALRPRQEELARRFTSCEAALNIPSPKVAEALSRFEGPTDELGRDYESGFPIALNPDTLGVSQTAIGRSIAETIGYVPLSRFEGSFWDQILRFTAEFGLMVVPRAQDAIVVPISAGLTEAYEIAALETDNQEFRWDSVQHFPLRGLGIFTPYSATLNNAIASKAASTLTLPQGCFTANADPDTGVLSFTQPPKWLSKVPVQVQSGVGVWNQQPVGMMMQNVTSSPIGQPELPQPQRPAAGISKNFYDEYARFRYVESALSARRLQLGSRFRTDIVPGSTIAVAARAEQLTSRVPLPVETMVGLVMAGTWAIRRSTKMAVTSYNLGFVRSLSELSDPRYSYDRHPIYQDQFLGAGF